MAEKTAKSDDECISLDSSDEDENFSESMMEVTSHLNDPKSALFDEDGASTSLKAYASTIDYQKDKVLTSHLVNEPLPRQFRL